MKAQRVASWANTPSSTSAWKWMLVLSAPPNRCTMVTAPLRPSAIPASRARRRWNAFVDPSGGSKDSMTVAIAHREGDHAVLDVVREARAPFSPEEVVAAFVVLLHRYGIRRVQGDAYGGEWPRAAFRKLSVAYDTCKATKSELYLELLARLNSGHVALLDQARLLSQLSALERRTSRSGRDTVDHPSRGHDDVANAAAGALVAAIRRTTPPGFTARCLQAGRGNRWERPRF